MRKTLKVGYKALPYFERVIDLKTKIYAAYGSNMNIEQMTMRCPNAKLIGTGVLKGYRLTFRGLSRSGVANIERHKDGEVSIVLWEITPQCEESLDHYEGYPGFYIKKDIEVVLEDKSKVKAMVYVMTKGYESYPAEPSKRYLDIILNGYRVNKIPIEPLTEAVTAVLEEVVEKENKHDGEEIFE